MDKSFKTTREILDWVEANTTEEHRGEGKSAEDAVIWFTAMQEAAYIQCDSLKELARRLIDLDGFPAIREIDDCHQWLFPNEGTDVIWEQELRIFWLGN